MQIEVNAGAQHTAQVLIDSAVGDPQELSLSAGPLSNGTTSGKPTKQLHVEEHPYYVVSATTDVLVLVVDYLRVMVNMPLLITDVMARVIEFWKVSPCSPL